MRYFACLHTKTLSLLSWLIFLQPAATLTAQSLLVLPAVEFTGYARGTGRTTGHIATLFLFNPSPASLRTEAGPYLIPGTKGYQGYVVHRPHPVTIPPFGLAEVRLEGYCTDISRPAAPRGELLADLSRWAAPVGSAPLPHPAMDLSAFSGWERAAPTAPDAPPLAFPGGAVPFPFRIAIDTHPASAANLLIHAAGQLEAVYDQTLRRKTLRFSCGEPDPESRRAAVVQQAFWYYTSRLREAGYGREDFALQVLEQAEQALDLPGSAFTGHAAEELRHGAGDFWATLMALCAEAGLLVNGAARTPAGDATKREALPFQDEIEKVAPPHPGALARWQAVRNGLENGRAALREEAFRRLLLRLNELLPAVVDGELSRLDPDDFSNLSLLLSTLDLIDSGPVSELDEKIRRRLTADLGKMLRELLDRRAGYLAAQEPVPLADLADLLLLFGSEDHMAYLKSGFVRKQRRKLRRAYQEQVVGAVVSLDPSDPEAGPDIFILRELLALNYLAKNLGGQVQADLLRQLDENQRLWVGRQAEGLDPAEGDIFDALLNLQYLLSSEFFTQGLDYPFVQRLVAQLDTKLRLNLRGRLTTVEAPAADALPELLLWLSRLERVESRLAGDTLTAFRSLLAEKLNRQLRYLSEQPEPASGRFLLDWRANDLMRTYWWWQAHGTEGTKALLDQRQERSWVAWRKSREGIVRPGDIPYQTLELTGLHWKSIHHADYPVLDPVRKPFPLWVAGIPASGLGAYILLRGGEGPPPPLLKANDDQLLISCGHTETINVLTNDLGEEIRFLSFEPAAGVTVVHTGEGGLNITVAGPGPFSIIYTITDPFGQQDEAVLHLQVAAPVLLAVEDNYSVPGTETLQANLLTNDTGLQPLILANTLPEGGTLTLAEDGDFTFVPDTSFCGPAGFVYTAGDICGQSDTAYVHIEVEDARPPELECPEDVLINCGLVPEPSITGKAVGSDNCDPAPDLFHTDAVSPGLCAQEQTIFRTWRITDAAGNSRECLQEIVQTDSAAPSIDCEPVVTVACGESFLPASLEMPEVEDNCTGPADLELTYVDNMEGLTGCGETGVIFRTWTITDACGNSNWFVQQINIVDNEAPVLEAPAGVTVDCDQDTGPQNTGLATATDGCSPAEALTVTYEDNPDGPATCGGGATIFRTWRATDACGNTVEAVQTIASTDLTPPEITCPDGFFVNCEESTEPVLTGQPAVTDNCDPDPALAHEDQLQSGSCINERLLTRTWRATDACGNVSECEQVITIGDTTPPELTLPPDLTIDCEAEAAPEVTGNATATDNCSGPDFIDLSYSDVVNPDACAGVTVLLRTWTATDPCGNTLSGVQKITRSSGGGSVFICPPNTIIDCSQPPLPVLTGAPTVTGGCGAAGSFDTGYIDELIPSAGSSFTIRRTWIVTDPCGFSSQCVQLILVQNTGGATVECPPDVTIECSEAPDPAQTGTPEITDNCYLPDELTWDYVDDASGLDGCCGTGELVRNWMFINLNGDAYTCTQVITLEDTTAPELICPPDISVDCGADLSPDQTGQATATDNGSAPGDIDIQYADNLDSLTACNGTGFLQRTWTVTDACGSGDTCVQIITITDDVPPMIDCPPTANVLCGQQFDTGITGQATATDNCGGDVDLTFTDDLTSLDGCEGAIIRTWTATDECGNIATCEQSVLVTEVVCGFTPTFDTTSADCDQANGSITVTLDPPGDYTIEWETGDTGSQLEELADGAYAVTITDNADACSQVFQVVVDQGEGDLVELVDVLPSDCGNSGDILLDLSGGDAFQVQVSGPGSLTLDDQSSGLLTLSDFMDVPPGLYTIEVTDAATGCAEMLTADVPSQAPFELTLEAFSDPSAPGASDGSITIEVIPAIYVLDIYLNGDYYVTEALPVFTIEDLPAGAYTIYAVDHSNPGCQSNSVVVTLADPADLWAPAWTAVPDLRYLPAALIQRRLFSHWLSRPGFEGPGSATGWSQDYGLRSFNGVSLAYHPGRYWEIRLDLFHFGGDGRLWQIDRSTPGIRGATDVGADFQGLTAGLSARFHPLQGRWRPWLGAGLTGSSWRSEYTTGVEPGEVRTGLAGWPYLSGGLRWSVWKKLAVELDLLIRATEGGGKRYEVLPGVRGRWRW